MEKNMASTVNEKIEFSDVAESCLLTFFCHAEENKRRDPILKDPLAQAIAEMITPSLATSQSRLQRYIAGGKIKDALVVHICLRAKKYDDYAREFLARNPGGTIVNIGCGLDTRFDRIDDGQVILYDLDMPQVIQLKKRLFQETSRYHLISSSVFDFSWMEQVKRERPQHVLFLAEGVFMYCEPQQVKDLVLEMRKQFPGSELVCEVVNKKWISPGMQKLLSFKMQRQLRMGRDSLFRFGVANSAEMEGWHAGIKFLDEWSYFESNHPRLGMLRWFAGSRTFQRTQWTLHYLLS